MNQLLKVAQRYRRKLAAFPTPETLKPAIMTALSQASGQRPELKAVKDVSNISVQNTIDYVHVAFVLDVDKNAYDEAGMAARKAYVKPYLEKVLPGYFGHANLKIDYSEYPV
jgi:hypothetical protein